MVDHIKAMTRRSNSQIIQDAVEQLYGTVFTNTVATLTQEILKKQQDGVPKADLVESYKKILTVLRFNYDSVENLKKALIVYGIPHLSGNSGAWKADQVRHLLKICNM